HAGRDARRAGGRIEAGVKGLGLRKLLRIRSHGYQMAKSALGREPARATQFLKQFSRCHARKCGCGRKAARCGANARPVGFTKLPMRSGSLTWRETRISRSSESEIRPRSNIQWT